MLGSRIPDSDRLRGTVRRGWSVESETTIDEGMWMVDVDAREK